MQTALASKLGALDREWMEGTLKNIKIKAACLQLQREVEQLKAQLPAESSM